ncbi:uncharacterized protein LOC142163149 [Nicotiana tabacum]|uniref:Uncharacterized protein LOC142163149 n=1 Tax=Nicotiana tabacum TaxID=4097 RepID=A0AC58RUT2_TOBAC
MSVISNSSSLWNKRLGHVPLKAIKKHELLRHLKSDSHQHCIVCPLAKQTKLPFQLSNTVSASTFDLLHCDIWGPYRVSTYDGKRFFVTIADDHTRFTWIFLLHSKSNTTVVLKEFFAKVKNIFSASVKILRTDSSSEFFSTDFKEFLSTLGVEHQIVPKCMDKFAFRAITAVLVGYSSTQKEYKLYDLQNNSFSKEKCATDISPLTEPSTSIELRRSSRPSKSLVWLQDYVTKQVGNSCAYPISSYVTYSPLKPPYQHMLALHSAVIEPKTFKEAISDPKWVQAMKQEVVALEDNNTWTIVDFQN